MTNEVDTATCRAIYIAKPKAVPISLETARDLRGRFRPAVSVVRMAVTQRSAARPDLAHRQEGLSSQAAGAVADFFQAFACRPIEAVIFIALACCPLLINPRLVRARSK